MSNGSVKQQLKLYENFRKVSIAEFFEKNRHLLGFDNPRKALLIAVKELVDNALDACEEHKILPDIKISIEDLGRNIYRIRVEDNGPGIPKDKIPQVFGSFLFGSKFHRYVSTRGKQGIGASAVVLYGQLTTGRPVKVISKVPGKDAYLFEIKIDVRNNTPIILKNEKYDKFRGEHGTIVEIILKGQYQRGKQSVDEYIRLTALANPHANIYYRNPKGEIFKFKRITDKLPELHEVKPHIHGIEIGLLERLLKETRRRTLKDFLIKTFSSIGEKTAYLILYKAFINPEIKDEEFDLNKLKKRDKLKLEQIAKRDPKSLSFEEIEQLYIAMQNTKVKAISAKYITTLGADLIREGLTRMFSPEFVVTRTRRPAVYRGIPFIVEVGIAYGGEIKERIAQVFRFANKVPLLYKAGECAITEAVKSIDWNRYGLDGKKGEIPKGPVIIMVHLASVWIPFTSESKEAIAPYPEIVKEIQLAIQDAARELAVYLRKKETLTQIGNKYLYLFGYGRELARYLSKLLEMDEGKLTEELEETIKQRLYEDLVEIIRTVKDLRELIREGKKEEAKKMLQNMLSDLIKKKVLKASELNVLIENALRNH